VQHTAPHGHTQGSEVIRLYHTLLGAEGFRKGMDLYFKRHDGQVRLVDCSLVVRDGV
jgi:aminopeptidase N